MLSRVAENLYWLSRYLERAENVARLLDIGMFLELDAADISVNDGSAPVEIALSILSCGEAYRSSKRPARSNGRGISAEQSERDNLLRFLTFDRANPQSILSMVAHARENAKETLGVDIWSEINRLYLYLSGRRAQERFVSSPYRFYTKITRSCVLVEGMIVQSLPRDEVYHFLQVGLHLERAEVIGRILFAKCMSLNNPQQSWEASIQLVRWASLLRSCSAYAAYLRTESDRIDPEGVVRFLVLNPDFPRSIRYCVARCRDSLQEISGGDDDDYGDACQAERLLGRLDSDLRYIGVEEIFERGLLSFLGEIEQTCSRVGREVQQSYFCT